MTSLKKVYSFSKQYEWCCFETLDLSYRNSAISCFKKELLNEPLLAGRLNHDINAFLRKRSRVSKSDDRNMFLTDLFDLIEKNLVYKGYVYSNFELETRLKKILMQSFVNDAYHDAKKIYENLFASVIQISCISNL